MDINIFKRKSTIALIICVVAIILGSVFAFFTHSNEVKAARNENSIKTENNKVATQKNNEDSNSQPLTPINSNYKEFFKDDAFLGDSISEGLSYYDFLDDNRVMAEKGLSITKGIDESDKIIALKPNRVFILFGVNNIDDRTPSTWLVGEYTKLVVKLKSKLPNSKIYIFSILPVLEKNVTNSHINCPYKRM